MKPIHLIAFIPFSLLLVNCSDDNASNTSNDAQTVTISQVSTRDKLDRLYAKFFNELKQLKPLDTTNKDKHQELQQSYLKQLLGIDSSSLSRSQLMYYQVFKRQREIALHGLAFNRLVTQTVAPVATNPSVCVSNTSLPAHRPANTANETLAITAAEYNYLIDYYTTTALTGDQLHRLGKAEVSRLQQRLQKRLGDISEIDSLSALTDKLSSTPTRYDESRSAMAKAYTAMQQDIAKYLTKVITIPPSIKPQLTFSATGCEPSARPRWDKTAWLLHHQLPGHQLQLALQQSLEHLPQFISYSYLPVYHQGWALYAESLADELGLEQGTDEQQLGVLLSELRQTALMVADTGLHAKGWAQQQVLDYLLDNAAMTAQQAATALEQIRANPGQALAAKTGQLKINELRREAEQKLGSHFDLVAFHHMLLNDGPLPLNLLQQKAKRWIVERRP